MITTGLIAVLLLGWNEPGPVTLELLATKLDVSAMVARVEIKVDQEGRTTTYSGVPLTSILDRRSKPIAGMPGLRDLADAVLLVRGADGYQAAVSAASVAMDSKGEQYILANQRDGQAIAYQLIIPGDSKRARWVKDVVAIRLVRLNAVVKAGP